MAKIVDTHLHCWDLNRINYSWLSPEAGILYRSFTPEMVETKLSEAGILQAILVQSDNSIADTEYMFECALQHKWISGVVGWLPLEDPDAVATLLNKYIKNPFFKGVRHLMHIEPDDRWILQDSVQQSLKLLSDKNIPFDAISINENQLVAIIITGEKIPGLKIMLDHMAQPPLNDANRFQQWQVLMSQAAINPQIFVKLSGLGTMTRQVGMKLEQAINAPIKHVLAQFGSKRICCGGDWPISLLDNPYTATWKSYTQVIHSLTTTDSDQSAILFNNAVEFYSLSDT
jgi:L-fuconolactonase